MQRRLTAGLIALVILVTGVIPAVAGYRCLMMRVRVAAPAPCCQHQDNGRAVKAPCCEAIAAAQLEPRRTPPSSDATIAPPTVVAWVATPPLSPVVSSSELTTSARARGRPPGERLHLFSAILRV